MSSYGRDRISTKALTAIVAVFAFTALLLVLSLAAALLVRQERQTRRAIALAPVISRTPAPDENARGAPALAAASSAETSASWTNQTAASTPNPLRAKPISATGDSQRPTWTATPIPTNTPTPSPTPNPTFVSSAYGLGDHMPDNIAPNERWIDVDVTGQKLVAYEGLIPVFESLVSTGTSRYPTVTGQFRIWLRFQSQDMDGYRLGYDYYLRDVPYVQYFYQDYALHGTFWHSNFGTPMSHGCVNLSPEAAGWLYDWAGYGTLVNVHP